MIQAVLFDLDGTLTNTIDDIATAMNRALRLHGLPGWETKEYCYLVATARRFWRSGRFATGRTWRTRCRRSIRRTTRSIRR